MTLFPCLASIFSMKFLVTPTVQPITIDASLVTSNTNHCPRPAKVFVLLFDSLCQNKDNFYLNEQMQQKMNKHKMNIGVNVPRTYTYKPIA